MELPVRFVYTENGKEKSSINAKQSDVNIVVTKKLYQEILKFVTENDEIQCEQLMNGLLFKLKEDSGVKLH